MCEDIDSSYEVLGCLPLLIKTYIFPFVVFISRESKQNFLFPNIESWNFYTFFLGAGMCLQEFYVDDLFERN